jgi:uncharacterized protein YndB with AHSA1/START domain
LAETPVLTSALWDISTPTNEGGTVADSPGLAVGGTLHSVDGKGVVRMKVHFENRCADVWSALTDPRRLALWYGKVEGELHEGGAIAAFVRASEWDGRGRIDACVPERKLGVTMWEEEGSEHTVDAELIDEGGTTTVVLEVRGLPLDFVWAYGAGWQVHLEDLGSHLAGRDSVNPPTRWDELEPLYREMTVTPL